jgi:hypothetical protein
MMRKFILPLSIALSALTFAACQEPIDLDLPPNTPELVVEGYFCQRDYLIPDEGIDCGSGFALTKNDLLFATAAVDAFINIDSIEAATDYFPFNKVQLSTSDDYFGQGQTPRVSDAVVKLFEDGEEIETLMEDPNEPGTYRITALPKVGSSYHLEIEALDNFYETSPEVYHAVPPLLSLPGLPTYRYGPNFIGDTCQYFLGLNTYEPPGRGDHYRWMFYLNNKYVSDPVFISTFDDSDVDGVCLIQFDIYGNPLELGDTLIVFQVRTSPGYSTFINSLRNQTAFVGGPFDTPPAPIRGNVKNVTLGTEAYGYFMCGGISASASIIPDTIPTNGCDLN